MTIAAFGERSTFQEKTARRSGQTLAAVCKDYKLDFRKSAERREKSLNQSKPRIDTDEITDGRPCFIRG